MRSLTYKIAAVALAATTSMASWAQEYTLRFHQFLPVQANVPANTFKPWIKKIATESNGRLKIQMFSSMTLGGTPPQLYGQASDGVVDIVWTLPGYTPGRFPKTEVFELPFIATTSGEKTSRAFWDYVQKNALDEYKDVHLLAAHVHGPGLLHTKQAITGLESLRGMKIRGGTRIVNEMLVKLGAEPVGMPVSSMSEALSKGVIDGTTLPWEVVPAFKVHQLTHNHTTFSGDRALYLATFVMAMNTKAYDKLPPDLKKVLDDNSGAELSALLGRTSDQGDTSGRAAAEKAGNSIVQLPPAEVQRWRQATSTVETEWVQHMKTIGIDGASLLKDAKDLVAKYQ